MEQLRGNRMYEMLKTNVQNLVEGLGMTKYRRLTGPTELGRSRRSCKRKSRSEYRHGRGSSERTSNW